MPASLLRYSLLSPPLPYSCSAPCPLHLTPRPLHPTPLNATLQQHPLLLSFHFSFLLPLSLSFSLSLALSLYIYISVSLPYAATHLLHPFLVYLYFPMCFCSNRQDRTAVLCYAILWYPILCYPMLRYPMLCYHVISYAVLYYPVICCGGQMLWGSGHMTLMWGDHVL